MKKLLAIMVLGLFFSGSAYAKCISGDCISGQGTLTHANGNKYVGEFKGGKLNGQGTATHANGNKYVENFKTANRTVKEFG